MQTLSVELNIVNCGICGKVFGHVRNVVELTCPYCGMKDDISSFPDWFAPEHDSSVFTLTKEKPLLSRQGHKIC